MSYQKQLILKLYFLGLHRNLDISFIHCLLVKKFTVSVVILLYSNTVIIFTQYCISKQLLPDTDKMTNV